jgi:hypothetical protein
MRRCRFALRFSHPSDKEEDRMRAIGLDVHLDFCEVAIAEGGSVRSAGRIETKPDQIELFAQSLGADDRVALEVTGNAWEIKRLIEPHVRRVVVVSPGDTGIRQARAKTDRLDARTLAKLLASGELDAVWVPDRETRVMRRRLQHRGQLVWARSRITDGALPVGRGQDLPGSDTRHLAADRSHPDLLRHALEQRHALLDEWPHFGRLERFGVLLLARPQVCHPDQVGVIRGLGDEIQPTCGVVVEQLPRLEQDLDHPIASTGLGGEPVEQCELHRLPPCGPPYFF